MEKYSYAVKEAKEEAEAKQKSWLARRRQLGVAGHGGYSGYSGYSGRIDGLRRPAITILLLEEVVVAREGM